ncbi:MAG TPA: DUF362 domain-containing protein, partial [Anaerolineae bacterium]|nr:DUF362 domain-containing protein [Anaerolineae bacterium]
MGSAGVSLGFLGITFCASPEKSENISRNTPVVKSGESSVSLVPGNDRREIICEALKPFEKEIQEEIQNKQIIIKLNCVRPNTFVVGTHKDALRGVLDFLKPIYDRPIIVGESTADMVDARGIYEHFGFLSFEKDYNIKFVELNDYPVSSEWILDANMYPVPIRILTPFVDPNVYVISLAKLKTHNTVVATLTLKNVVMGAPQKILSQNINDKSKVHATSRNNRSPKMLNFNLFRLAHSVYPDLCVIDGFEGLQGDGPNEGTAVESRVALAGTDFVAVDRIGLELMGIPWENVGYLQYCATGGL